MRVLKSLAGEGQSVSFAPPFTEEQFQDFLRQIGRPWSADLQRSSQRDQLTLAQEFGARLFDTVFAGPVGTCLRRSLDRSSSEDSILRIRLWLAECQELSVLPWELLYDTIAERFLALSAWSPVVRYLQLPEEPRPVPVKLPLKLLVIKSDPVNTATLQLDSEREAVKAELGPLIEAGSVEITELAAASLSELHRVLLKDTFHVLYYLGHGGFSERSGGLVQFTDEKGRAKLEPARKLDVLLHDHASLRLAIVNGCETGRTDPASRFGGVADALVRTRIPAVIAMQFSFTDRAAIRFAPALLGALAAGRPIDAAMGEARKEIYAIGRTISSVPEWATPVLYLRGSDAHLFTITRSGTVPAADPVARRHLAEGDSLCAQSRFAEAEAEYRLAIQSEPGLARAHAGLGLALDRQDRHRTAEAACREAIRLDPRNAQAYANLGHALDNQERYEEAEEACREALHLDPANAYAHNGLGNVMRDLLLPGEAEAEYREAIRLDPGLVFAHNGLGNVLTDLRRYAEAEAAYREAIRLNPGLPFLRRNLDYVLRADRS